MKKLDTYKIKKTLFIVLVLALSIPLIQQYIKFANEKTLAGAFTKLEKPSFSIKKWFDGTYQTKQQDYYNQNFGFRSFFVTVYNQTQYSLFTHAKASGVIIGKDKYLYELNYIKAYLGRDYIGENKIIDKVNKLQKVSDTLKSKGIDLIFVMAPGKGSFYPEFIPEKFEPNRKTITNYQTYKDVLSKSSIHYLDFHQWINSMKQTSEHRLFPKTGIHWSKYTEFIAADSILKYVSHIKNTPMPKLVVEKIEKSYKMQNTDDDIENGMNLVFNIKDLEMSYPVYKVINNNPKLNLIAVGDSYFWGIKHIYTTNKIFDKRQFWYYFKNIYLDDNDHPQKIETINKMEEIEKSDVIILLATDANLPTFSFGFIDELYAHYFNPSNNN